MIGLMKSAFKGKEKRKEVVFRSFGEKNGGEGNLSPSSYHNCDFRGGVLRGGIGLKKCLNENGEHLAMSMTVSAGAPHAFFVTQNKDGAQANTTAIYLVGTDGYLYLRRDNGTSWQRILIGNNVEHCAMKNEGKAIYNFFCGAKTVHTTLDGIVFRTLFTEENVGGCVCNKRYFLLGKNGDLFYTAALDPLDTDTEDPNGAGRIYLPIQYGAPVGIKEYCGAVYIFFEKGICKLTVSANPRENVVKEIAYHGGNICLRGQAVTSNGVIFLASEGAYYLRNDRVERICEHLSIGPCATNKNCGVGYCEELVIFSYYKEKDGAQELCRLVLYADGKDGYFSEAYGALSGNEYAYVNGKFYCYAKDNVGIQHKNNPFFTSEEVDFATKKNKRLKTLLVKGEGSVSIGVKCGERECVYPLVFKNGIAKIKLREKGKSFSFHFYLNAGSLVSGMKIEYVTEGKYDD